MGKATAKEAEPKTTRKPGGAASQLALRSEKSSSARGAHSTASRAGKGSKVCGLCLKKSTETGLDFVNCVIVVPSSLVVVTST